MDITLFLSLIHISVCRFAPGDLGVHPAAAGAPQQAGEQGFVAAGCVVGLGFVPLQRFLHPNPSVRGDNAGVFAHRNPSVMSPMLPPANAFSASFFRSQISRIFASVGTDVYKRQMFQLITFWQYTSYSCAEMSPRLPLMLLLFA